MSVSVPVIDYIDASTRRIYLLAGVTEYHPLDDIYAEVRNLRRTNEALRKYLMFIEGGGNIPKNASGTLRTPRYAIFRNCKVVVSGDTLVTGEQLYADAAGDVVGKGPDAIDHSLSPANAYLDYEPPGSEVILVSSDDAAVSRKFFTNRQELAPDGTWTLYDDDGATPLLTQHVSDKDDAPIILRSGVAAKKTAAT